MVLCLVSWDTIALGFFRTLVHMAAVMNGARPFRLEREKAHRIVASVLIADSVVEPACASPVGKGRLSRIRLDGNGGDGSPVVPVGCRGGRVREVKPRA